MVYLLIFNLFLSIFLNSSEVRLSVVKNSLLISQNLYERVEVITKQDLKNTQGQTLEEKISNLIPGINISRTNGIYSFKSVVSMRGYSSYEQARTLVLLDGIPINNNATGSVNWNMLSMLDIERVEVFKGASSFVYGSNAITGVINIISAKPDGQNKFSQSFQTYNTFNSKINTSYKNEKNSVLLSGGFMESDGYISTPDNLITDYTVKKFAREKSFLLRDILNTSAGEFDFRYSYYDGIRGEGVRINSANGLNRKFLDNNLALKWNQVRNDIRFESFVYYNNEKYERFNEYFKSNKYTKVETDSVREDFGINSSVLFRKFEIDNIFGIEASKSLVNSKDIQILPINSNSYNRGDVYKYSAYYNLRYERNDYSFTSGFRYDMAGFYEGYYANDLIINPGVNGTIDSSNWDSFSYKLYFSKKYLKNIKHYVSYGTSFRAPVIEDMCLNLLRGTKFTQANQYLKPEKVYSFETGLEVNLLGGFYFDPSFYYDSGKNFIYEVNTGNTININGIKPIYKKENIAKVRIYGYELPFKYSDGFLSVILNYSNSRSKLLEYPKNTSIEGKELSYSPREIISSSFSFDFNKFTIGFGSIYKSSQFLDDLNNQRIGSYSVYWSDLKFFIKKNFEFYAYVNNIFDNRYQESEADMSPGRIVGLRISFYF